MGVQGYLWVFLRFVSAPNFVLFYVLFSLQKYCPSTPLLQNRTEGTPIQTFSPIDLSPIGPYCDKPCNSTSNKMQARTPLRGKISVGLKSSSYVFKSNMVICDLALENKQCFEIKLEETPNTKRSGKECFKVFESPKLANQNRRSRKRRRSVSQDINMSVSYSSILTKHKVLGTKRSFGESRMLVDNSNDVLTESQDTGYQTESATYHTFGAEKNFLNNSNIKSLALECLKKENKENCMVASTPTM